MDRKADITKKQPKVGDGKDVTDTQMLTGTGKLTSAQNETNSTEPYSTGKAPGFGKLGDRMGR